uniref:CHK kinase-like domain-containing protein n=1 Tax=Photinus pyralis TaxID=7054 RepID=A0A1Y1JTU1_PHOPY
MSTKQQWLTDAQVVAFEEFLNSVGIQNYELKCSPAIEDGENFGGVILNVDLLGVKNSDVPINHFIIKCSPRSALAHSAVPFVNVYNLEIYLYSTIFPEFLQIQKEKDVGEVFQPSPKFYTSLIKHREEMLVLEDVKLRWYVHHHRYLPLNYDHVLIMVKQYAKIHALSYAVRDQKPQLFQEFQKNMRNHFFEDLTFGAIQTYVQHRLTHALKALNRDQDGPYYDKFVYLAENWNSVLKSLMSKSQHPVVCHIDCGISNALFKYQHTKIPTEVILLDWQHSRVDSPAVDLVAFILSSADASTLEKFDELVVEYYKSLSSFLRELGSDPNEVLPFEVLQSELKTYGIVGLLMTVLLLHVYAAGNQKLPNLVTDESYSSGFVFTYNLDDRTHYDSRMRAAVSKFHRMGYNFM